MQNFIIVGEVIPLNNTPDRFWLDKKLVQKARIAKLEAKNRDDPVFQAKLKLRNIHDSAQKYGLDERDAVQGRLVKTKEVLVELYEKLATGPHEKTGGIRNYIADLEAEVKVFSKFLGA